jgi:hypothetical protein
MGIFQNIIEHYKEKKAKERAMVDDMNIRNKIESRTKNANEREYERYLEEVRQKRIQYALARFRQQKQNELWRANAIKGDMKAFRGNQLMREPRVRMGVQR